MRLLLNSFAGPERLYKLERHLWLELWRTPYVEAIEENGLHMRLYGPVQATVLAGAPRTPLFNLVLGADDPGAVVDGHLSAALDWTESLGVDCRIPIRQGFLESEAAEELLEWRGYRRTASLVRFVRDTSPPEFPEPPGIEIDEWTEETEGFGYYFEEGYDLSFPATGFFDGLPGRQGWRSYVAIDEKEEGAGAATMMVHPEAVQLAFATTKETCRGRGVHMALLRRRILDAPDHWPRPIFADTEEPLDDPDGPSRAARNLLRAGFKQLSVRSVWRPPLADDAEDEDYEDDGDDYEDDDLDEDHDFDLED